MFIKKLQSSQRNKEEENGALSGQTKENTDYEEDGFWHHFRLMLQREKEKMACMNKKQKWSYFKTYYMTYSIIALLLLCCLGWFLYDVLFSRTNVLYSGAMIGCEVSEEGRYYLTDGFREYADGREGKDSVLLSEDLWIAFSPEDVEEYQAMYNNIYVNIAAGDFNYMFLDAAMLSQFAKLDILVNLDELVSVYGFSEEDLFRIGGGETVGVRLNDSVRQKLQLTSVTDEVYLVLVDVRRDVEKDRQFLDYLFQWRNS